MKIKIITNKKWRSLERNLGGSIRYSHINFGTRHTIVGIHKVRPTDVIYLVSQHSIMWMVKSLARDLKKSTQ